MQTPALRDRHIQVSSGLQYPINLQDAPLGLSQMLQGLGAYNAVEIIFFKRNGFAVCDHIRPHIRRTVYAHIALTGDIVLIRHVPATYIENTAFQVLRTPPDGVSLQFLDYKQMVKK